MKKTAGTAAFLLLAGAGIALVVFGADRKPTQRTELTAADKVARGRYLVSTMGCDDCHTPFHLGPNGPEPDLSRHLSGHPQDLVVPPPPPASGPWVASAYETNTAWAGPWGISYTANLTPDEVTGLGTWTEEIFVNALRTGRHWGQSRPILPPMPWSFYRNLTDEDLSALFAYLRSIPPIRNQVPDAVLAEPEATH